MGATRWNETKRNEKVVICEMNENDWLIGPRLRNCHDQVGRKLSADVARSWLLKMREAGQHGINPKWKIRWHLHEEDIIMKSWRSRLSRNTMILLSTIKHVSATSNLMAHVTKNRLLLLLLLFYLDDNIDRWGIIAIILFGASLICFDFIWRQKYLHRELILEIRSRLLFIYSIGKITATNYHLDGPTAPTHKRAIGPKCCHLINCRGIYIYLCLSSAIWVSLLLSM